MFSKKVWMALAIAVTLMASASSAQAAVWDFTGNDAWNNYRVGDHFVELGNGQWMEVINPKGVASRGPTQRFYYDGRLVYESNGRRHFYLYDASRNLEIKLYLNSCYIRYPGSNGYFYMAAGSWRQ